MPELVRLYISQVLVGFVIAALVVAGIIVFDVAGLGGLIARSDVGLLATFMLWMFNGIVFAAVQFAVRIMFMAEDDDSQRGRPAAERATIAVPVPVAVPVRTDRR